MSRASLRASVHHELGGRFFSSCVFGFLPDGNTCFPLGLSGHWAGGVWQVNLCRLSRNAIARVWQDRTGHWTDIGRYIPMGDGDVYMESSVNGIEMGDRKSVV